MKMSTAWFRFRGFSPANYFMAVAGLGIEYVEVTLYSDSSKWFGPVLPDETRRLAQDCGVRMVSGVAALDLAGPFDELGRPLTDEAAGYSRVMGLRAIDQAEALGLDVVRITEPNIGPEHQHLAEKYVNDIGVALCPIADRALDKGIQVAVENYGLTSDQMVWLLDAADHENVGTLFDPCNYARMGEDPLEALLKIQDRVVYCHLKDTRSDEQGSPEAFFPGSRFRPSVAVGDGDIDWTPLLTKLTESYNGYASIEYENVDDLLLGTRRSLDYVAATLQQTDRSMSVAT
jgi:sugar phosphate isomerase/epimerase